MVNPEDNNEAKRPFSPITNPFFTIIDHFAGNPVYE
jgi:hypothetical protein